LLKPNDLLHNYIKSLTPYFDHAGQKNKALTTMKVKEAIMILLETEPALKNILFDFNEPGKADLVFLYESKLQIQCQHRAICLSHG